MMHFIMEWLPLLNLIIPFIVYPSLRFIHTQNKLKEKLIRDIEELSRSNMELKKKFMDEIEELKKANTLLKEEIHLLRTVLFKSLPGDQVKEFLLKEQELQRKQ